MRSKLTDNIWFHHVFSYLNVRDVFRWIWVNRVNTHIWFPPTQECTLPYQNYVSNVLTRWMCNDRQYIRQHTVRALIERYTQQHAMGNYYTIRYIQSIYTSFKHQLLKKMQTSSTTRANANANVQYEKLHTQSITIDVELNTCAILHRGVCQCTPQHILWDDLVSSQRHRRSFEWLTLPPWELTTQACFTMWLPSEHGSVPPYVTSVVGEPEDTICMTNYRQMYRFNILDSKPEQEILFGGAFESCIQNLTLMHYAYPFVIVSGQPLYYDAPSCYKCFGVWDIAQKESVLDKFSQTPACTSDTCDRECDRHCKGKMKCKVNGIQDFLFYELLCVLPCGEWIYWKYHHTLYAMHLLSQECLCYEACVPFQTHFVQRFVVCRLKKIMMVYCGKDNCWVLYDLYTHEHLHTFQTTYKTDCMILPFCSAFRFTRKLGTKLVVFTLTYDLPGDDHMIGSSLQHTAM